MKFSSSKILEITVFLFGLTKCKSREMYQIKTSEYRIAVYFYFATKNLNFSLYTTNFSRGAEQLLAIKMSDTDGFFSMRVSS